MALTPYKKEIIRKTVHMLIFLFIFLHSFSALLSFYFLIFSILLFSLLEILRLKNKRVFYFHDLVEICARKEELKTFLFQPFLLIFSVFLVLSIFEPIYSYLSILITAFSDSFSTLIGMKYGKRRLIFKKTLEGSATFFFITFFILSNFFNLEKSLLIALILTFVELFSKKIDNFTVPLFSAFILSLI